MYKVSKKRLIIIVIFSIFILFCLFLSIFKISADLSQRKISHKIEENRHLIHQLISAKENGTLDATKGMTYVTDDKRKTIIPNEADSNDGGLGKNTLILKDNVSLPHILDNNDKVYYLNSESSPWHLEKGDTLEIEFYADEEYYDSPGSLIFGYCLNKKETSIEQFRINKYKKFSFKATASGDYSFYLHCVSSDPIIIEGVVIK